MKRHFAGIAMLLLLGTFSWGQGTKEPFDARKSTEELEIMKGILNTTLNFLVQKSEPKQTWSWHFSNSNAFYLAGQGAVFIIPTSALRATGFLNTPGVPLGPEFDQEMEALSQEINALSREVSREATRLAWGQAIPGGVRGGVDGGVSGGVGSGIGSGVGAGTGSSQGGKAAPAPPSPPSPPTPPTPPAPPAPFAPPAPARTEVEREKLRKAVEDARGRTKQIREEAEANRQKFLQNIAGLKPPLIEALANYGDSITTVKPEEYINLVLITDGFDEQRTRSDVISARKSWITDYKAGRLTMEGFKQKVVQYNQ
jgi:hypothetical protein